MKTEEWPKRKRPSRKRPREDHVEESEQPSKHPNKHKRRKKQLTRMSMKNTVSEVWYSRHNQNNSSNQH